MLFKRAVKSWGMTVACGGRFKECRKIESKLNRNFNALCDWFLENKLSIRFGEDKTKSILLGVNIAKTLKN